MINDIYILEEHLDILIGNYLFYPLCIMDRINNSPFREIFNPKEIDRKIDDLTSVTDHYIYYNYNSKREFPSEDVNVIVANLVDSSNQDASVSTDKLIYITSKIANNLIFNQIFIYTSHGNIEGSYIEENNENENYKHSNFYHITSATGIYKNNTQLQLTKLDGNHQPRMWHIL